MIRTIKLFFTTGVLILLLFSCSDNTIEVKTKENFDLVELPDGSIVYLNHNSTLSYDPEFQSRHFEIEGELYFDVVEDDTPFIIFADLGTVTVVGTEFSVKTEDDEMEVEVAEGSVEISTDQHLEKIDKGGRAVYKGGEKGIRKMKAEFKFKSWMNELKVEFKKLGKEFKKSSKEVGRESKKALKELKKGLKELK